MTWVLIFWHKVWNCCPERYGKFQSDIPSSSGAICEKTTGGPFAPPAGRGLRSIITTIYFCILFIHSTTSMRHAVAILVEVMTDDNIISKYYRMNMERTRIIESGARRTKLWVQLLPQAPRTFSACWRIWSGSYCGPHFDCAMLRWKFWNSINIYDI